MTALLIRQLATVARDRLLDEKRLLAPSLRVGRQWVQQAARLRAGLVNVRVTTLKRLAVDLTLRRQQVLNRSLLCRRAQRLLVEQVWRDQRQAHSEGELARQPWADLLAPSLARTLLDLRLAGVTPDDVLQADLSRGKRLELAELLRRYSQALDAYAAIDDAILFDWAVEAILDQPLALGPRTCFLVPADLTADGLPRRLLDQLPGDQPHWLATDPLDALPADEPMTDRGRLRFLFTPEAAPPVVRDGSVHLVAAVDPAAEVDAVLRTALQEGWPLDQIEVLHSDDATYLPLWLERAAALATAAVPELKDGVPVNFAQGLPVRLTRPGRALIAWLDWIDHDFAQTRLLDLLQDELLRPIDEGRSVPCVNAVRLLRKLPVGWGKARWLEHLHEARESKPAQDAETWKRVRNWLRRLLQLVPPPDTAPTVWLKAAESLLHELPVSPNVQDQQAAHRLLAEIAEYRLEAERFAAAPRDMVAELRELVEGLTVTSQGPRAGVLHVAHWESGGHSGRPITFLLGLDEDRFQFTPLTDPLLSDAERRQVSPELATAQDRSAQRRARLSHLLARLRGQVWLSYPCCDVGKNDEVAPSEVVRRVRRLLDIQTKEKLPIAGLFPSSGAPCLARDDAWLTIQPARFTEQAALALLDRHHPHWADGLRADQARASANLTPFDGWVPAAGRVLGLDGPTPLEFSPSTLETLGRCPLAFFFQTLLRLKEPEEPDEAEPGGERWLAANIRGSALHDLFHRFTSLLIAQDRRPSLERDRGQIVTLLQQILARQERRTPMPSPSVHRQEVRDLTQVALLFLAEEADPAYRGRACYVEVSVRHRRDEATSPLDHPEPPRVEGAPGLALRLTGRIDRIDQVDRGLPRAGEEAETEFWVWDFKTGRPYDREPNDVRAKGRHMQPLVYTQIATQRLRAEQHLGPQGQVAGFGYFFASTAGMGERQVWSQDALSQAQEALARVLRLAHVGTFLATQDERDCTFCDFRSICSIPAANRATLHKLDHIGQADVDPEVVTAVSDWAAMRLGPSGSRSQQSADADEEAP